MVQAVDSAAFPPELGVRGGIRASYGFRKRPSPAREFQGGAEPGEDRYHSHGNPSAGRIAFQETQPSTKWQGMK